jgi:hypothetical protein
MTSHRIRGAARRLTGLCCLVAAVLALASPAAAADRPAPLPAAAPGPPKGLLARGLAAETAGDLGSAVELLSAAYRQSPQPEVLFHLGRIAVAEGRQLDAHDLFRRYLADPARQLDDAATRTAEKFVAQRPPPGGSVSVLSDPGALVLVDNRLIGTLPLPLPLLLSPGTHKVTLEFLDKKFESQVDVQLGRLIELRITRTSGTALLSVVPAILHLVDAKTLPDSTARLFAEALEQAARIEQHTLLDAERALVATPELAGCLVEPGCRRRLAQRNAAEFVLRQRTQVEPAAEGAAFKIELTLWRTAIAAPAATVALSCTPCDARQAAAKLKSSAARLFAEGLSRPFGTLALTTDPPDAEVRIDEQLLPRDAPGEALWAGTYALSVRRRGHAQEQRQLVIRDGEQATLHVRLERGERLAAESGMTSLDGRSPTESRARPRWRLALGGTLLGLGVGLAVTGAVGLARDGQCVEAPLVENAACPRLFTTQTAGAIGIGLGAALLGGGIALIVVPGRRPVWTAQTKSMNTAR